MTKLASDRNTKHREGILLGLEAGEEIFGGGMVAVNANGQAVPATASGKDCVGVARHHAAKGEQVRVRRGTFNFADDAGDITRADIGVTAYVVDDQTITKTKAEGVSAVAGIIRDVDSDGVWVEM